MFSIDTNLASGNRQYLRMSAQIDMLLDSLEQNLFMATVISGLAVAFVCFLCRECYKRFIKKDKAQGDSSWPSIAKIVEQKNNTINGRLSQNIVVGNVVYTEKTETPVNRIDQTVSLERSGLRERLHYVLDSINYQKSGYNAVTIANLADMLKYRSADELMGYFEGNAYPTTERLQRFCEVFGLNYKWLAYGQGSPFKYFMQNVLYPFDTLAPIKNANPEQIYFVLSDVPERAVTLILKFSDFNYQIVGRSWHLSLNHVGATGQSQIVSFWKLSKELHKEHFLTSDIELSSDNWQQLINGKVWPGTFCEHPRKLGVKFNDWADDFCDVLHVSRSLGYRRFYGDWFVETQSYIKQRVATG
jgi:hypothetical protein